MSQKRHSEIVIQGARTNNLKGISLRIPHNKFIVVTGISGSGKSSLIFDVLAKEGQRRYFESMPSFVRQFIGRLSRPDVDSIEGLSPVIAIGQSTSGMHARSTVGTMSDIYDLLRLLYARVGKTDRDIELSRALFSFNSDKGKCPRCVGVGKEEKIDLNKLIAFPDKTIREGALAPTLPTGYVMYSQVTIDVLNQVCEAEGFNVDITWNDLTQKEKDVILYGSYKIKVPFGKHSLESRLKWTGIKAKPREEGYYKGMIPIMSDILRRDRNANILKYVHSITCESCGGSRLNEDALSVEVKGKSIHDLASMDLNELNSWIRSHSWKNVAAEIVEKISVQIDLLEDLGLGHLKINRPAKSLSSSEIQRIRVANQITVPLSNVLYVFDEPSIGLHTDENQRMIYHFKELVRKGNTVIVVEHDLDTIAQADHIVDIGPQAGVNGGELLFNGALSDFLNQNDLNSLTLQALQSTTVKNHPLTSENKGELKLNGCAKRNLKNINVEFQLGKLNVVSGRSGVGKSSLVKNTLMRAVQKHLGEDVDGTIRVESIENIDRINKLIFIDHSPIGKTPRSNPATYLGLSDYIRDIFATTPAAKEVGYTKSRFSFNNKGGRCETCQGAGKTQIGMHFLGNVDLVCETCNGDRFNEETLKIQYNGKSIAEIYKLSVHEAIAFFYDQKKVLKGLQLLSDIGLGYLTLGQSSTTLSGGEAQRIKIANQLQKKDTGATLYVIIEPSIGLHHENIQSVLDLFDTIKASGNTIVCIEQNEHIIYNSDWHIELGPKGGKEGGEIVFHGVPKKQETIPNQLDESSDSPISTNDIVLQGVTTHMLKNIDVRIPKNQLTVVTGLSGSGKSSLVYDTLFAEANARFTESLSAYNRSFIQQNSEARIESHSGLGPAIGINRKGGGLSKRSTVGTHSGIYDSLRLLYSRIAQQEGKHFTAQHYSFNHHLGACPECEGLGVQLKCDPDKIVVHPKLPVLEGAISTDKVIKYYADLNGQFIATLREVAHQKSWNLNVAWEKLSDEIQAAIFYGTGNEEWNVTWEFTTKSRTGTQELTAKWLGLCNYVEEEYQRRKHNKKVDDLESLLHDVKCPTCSGSRLKSELLETRFLGRNIHEITEMSVDSLLQLIGEMDGENDRTVVALAETVIPGVLSLLNTISSLGLGYLSLDRSTNSLSGGERQRITLAGQLSTNLFGVTYVLDEPTIGLDAEQVQLLTRILKQIVENGNTVVVVEHDAGFIRSADYLIEMGPAAGQSGGEVIFQGKPENVKSVPTSVTHRLLNIDSIAEKCKTGEEGQSFGVKGAFANNLKNIDVSFASGQMTAITGVSGSGKSSLIIDTLYQCWLKQRAVECSSVFGLDQFENVLLIDQSPLSENRLSTPATHTGIIDKIKTLFSKTDSAKEANMKKADFSYQSKKGKCPTCTGYGKLKTSMDFMSDIWLPCHDCNGLRYSKEVLSCTYQDRSIGEVLQMTVDEALSFFESTDVINGLDVLKRVGVGHLQLGQAGNTLSGGEAQRLKLATALMKKRTGKTLYLFDEPSTGLHYFDILNLFDALESIVEQGDTVLIIEHNDTLIERANNVIKLGPESGALGGEVVL